MSMEDLGSLSASLLLPSTILAQSDLAIYEQSLETEGECAACF